MNTLYEITRFSKAWGRYLALSFFAWSFVGMNCTRDTDKKATMLTVEKVPSCEEEPTRPDCADTDRTDNLFSLQPGQSAKIGSLGAVDPVGTSLSGDYDGDGLTNSQEMMNNTMFSNFWVADYPMIDTNVSPPISMRVEVIGTTSTDTTQVISDITSLDVESQRSKGSEKFHQNELAKRTTKIGSTSSKASVSASVSAGATIFGVGAQASARSSYSKTTAVNLYAARPFKNNIDRNVKSVKSTSAQNKARKYRTDIKTQKNAGYKTNPDGGYIRAAMYINNLSSNMPVRISNVLCSLLFETAEGELIPVQSFRLRNSDYSIFSIEIYGGNEFGPYVMELTGLNSVEIENAIAKGYTPKVHIVDYEMTHVADSNYKATLNSSFTGDNLKIIEENAKGRTALIKLIGPNMREMFRASAFTVDGENALDACEAPAAPAWVAPGVSMKRELERIACSGAEIEFEHVIFDFSGTEYAETLGVFYTEIIKSIDGVTNNFPCSDYVNGTAFNGTNVEACVIKPAELDPAIITTLALWTVFDNGKYYDQLERATDGSGNPLFFDTGSATPSIPLNMGLNSTVWAGDNYDVVYMNMADLLNRQYEFGTNPLETEASFAMNTRWNKDDLGLYPYDPDVRSTFLGKAGIGDRLEFEITLSDTAYLNPSFGTPLDFSSYKSYDQFSYDLQLETTRRFTIEEALDLEISFGLGGTKANWYNISRTLPDMSGIPATAVDTTNSDSGLASCGHSWDYLAQVYRVCIEVPENLAGVGPEALVNVYIRPSLNNAYRETIWPQDYADVKRFDSDLASAYAMGETFVEVVNGAGEIELGAIENGTVVTLDSNTANNSLHSYAISSVSLDSIVYEIAISAPATTTPPFIAGATVTAGASFNATLKNNTASGKTTFKVIPDTNGDTLSAGFVEQGTTLTINGSSYTISVVSELSNVYTLNLSTPLAEAHNATERLFIDGDLTKQQVAVMMDTSFIDDWNIDYLNSHTASYSPYDGRMLYGADITGCSYGLDNLFYLAPGCQGYDPGSLISNWIGAGSFDNNWSDGSLDSMWLSNLWAPRATTSTGSNLKTLPLPANEVHSVIASENPESANWNDRTVVVWAESNGTDTDIHGQIVDPTTGKSVGARFPVSTTNGANQTLPKIAIYGDIAFVVWQSEETLGDIRGRFIDLTNPAASSPDFLVNTITANQQTWPKVFITPSGKALVAWNWMNSASTQWDIRGRAYNMATLLPSTGAWGSDLSDFRINTLNTNNQIYVEGAQYDTNKVFLVWADRSNGVHYNIRGQFLDLDTESSLVGADILVSTSNTNLQTLPSVSANGDTAVVVWRTDDITSGDQDVRGRFVDLPTASFVGTDFLLHNVRTLYQYYSSVKLGNTYGLACWRSGATGDSYCRALDVLNRQLLGTGEILVGTNTALDQGYPRTALINDTAYVVWRSQENTGWSYRSQVIDLPTQSLVTSTDYLISDRIYTSAYLTETFDGANTPDLITHGNNVMAFWANEEGMFSQRLVPDTFFPIEYGINNFFVSPLVERNYSVKTRLRWD